MAAAANGLLSPVASLGVQDVSAKEPDNPISGMRDVPLLSCEEALRHAIVGDPDLSALADELAWNLQAAQDFADNFLINPPSNPPPVGGPLRDREEIAALNLFTQDSPLCTILNARLCTEKREVLVPFRPLLKLLLMALYKLPRVGGLAYRGVRENMHDSFVENTIATWWAFSSTARSISVMENSVFAGYKGQRTIFTIEVCAAFDVSRYSALANESKLLLAPGTRLKVVGRFSPEPNVHMISLVQQPFVPLPDLIDQVDRPVTVTATRADPSREVCLASFHPAFIVREFALCADHGAEAPPTHRDDWTQSRRQDGVL
jgi:hypothetical protein